MTNNPMVINLDTKIFDLINSIRIDYLNDTMIFITSLGDIYQSLTIFIVLSIILIVKRKKISFYIFTLASALGIFLPQIIKSIITRIRPVSPLLEESYFSFPSGHATIATVFLISIILLFLPLIKDGLIRKISLILAIILFPLIAFSRIYLSVHWTSDIIAGIILGISSYIISNLIISIYNNKV
jgi:undecaprenyl-diphosphatase